MLIDDWRFYIDAGSGKSEILGINTLEQNALQ
jgi:hypothetical protein